MLHRPVNFSIKIKENFIFPAFDQNTKYQVKVFEPEKIIEDESIYFFKKINCEIKEIHIFSGKEKTIGPLHIDGYDISEKKGALNLSINSNNWIMEWFKYNNTNDNFNKLISKSGGTKYIPLRTTDCTKIDQCFYKNLFLVRVDVPHRIINFDKKERHCISIRFHNNNFDYLSNILP